MKFVFPIGVQSFKGRVQNLKSLAAGFCSVRFNAHLAACHATNSEPRVKDSAHESMDTAHFDGRLFVSPSVAEALSCLLWRCCGDATRNSVNAYAHTFFFDEQLREKSTTEVLDMKEKETRVPFSEDVPIWAFEGSIVKREHYEHTGVNVKTDPRQMAMRIRTVVEDRSVKEFSK